MPYRRPQGAKGRLVALAAASALFTVLAPAAAGSRAADGLLDLPFEDLLRVEVRSAGKREEQIRDIPASVTILTREDIARYGWITFEELLRNVPGFYLLDNTEDRFIGTRGAVGGGVQFLVNGIPQHPSLQKTLTATEITRLDLPVESIDRVEIIRGPMSVIYGNNAFQGVVNVVTDGIDRSAPRVSASLGSLDLSAEWRGWQGNLRLNRRDCGIYAFTPPFDEGTRIQLDTLHGSLGYVLKTKAAADLIAAIDAALRGETYVSPALAEPAPRPDRGAQDAEPIELSARERDVLRLLAEGRRTKEIGEALGISPKTVETYRGRIGHKLRLETLADLVKYAVRAGIARGSV